MPIITSTAGHANWGRDIQIALVGGAGSAVIGGPEAAANSIGLVTTITNVTMFEYNQEVIAARQVKLDSTKLLANIPNGWRGSIEFVRADNDIDVMIGNIEADWYINGVYNNGHMDVIITDPVGGDFTMHFLDVAVTLENGGQFSGERFTTVRLAWDAAQLRAG